MKIALVTPYDYPYPGGVTEHVRHLDREFRALGHDTRIVAPSTKKADALAPNVIRVSSWVRHYSINGSTARWALSPAIYPRIKAILNAERFDVVHLHEPGGPLTCLLTLCHSSAVNVGTFHAFSEKIASHKYAKLYMQWIDSRLAGRIFVSRAQRDTMKAYLTGAYRVIPNGIDCGFFAMPNIRPIAKFDDGRPNILFVGRLDERKGFPHLLCAYSRIKNIIPDARLLVVGAFNEEDKEHMTRYARVNNLSLIDVHFIGLVSDEEKLRYYRTATISCVPSTGRESFGVVLLEAMAAGVPIVASNIDGYRDVVHDSEEGSLVPPGNEQVLAEAIVALLRDPARRMEMAARGRETAKHYDWKDIADRVLEFYDEALRVHGRLHQSAIL